MVGSTRRNTGPDTTARANRLARIRQDIVDDPSNSWAREAGYRPLFAAAPPARVAIIGQAPGLRAQEGGTAWADASGVALREWLGVIEEQFYDDRLFALLPMDFYFPGKGSHGDLPPRPDFAPMWHPRILAELPDLRLTVLIGGYAQKFYLGTQVKRNLTATVQAYQEYLPSRLPLVHPSPLNFRWQAKNPWFRDDVVPELRRQIQLALADQAGGRRG